MSHMSVIVDVNGHPFASPVTVPMPAPSPMNGYGSREELLGDLLYFHLDCARQSAARLDRMQAWGERYEAEFRVRRAALSRAREKLRELASGGYPIPEDLIPIVTFEGLA